MMAFGQSTFFFYTVPVYISVHVTNKIYTRRPYKHLNPCRNEGENNNTIGTNENTRRARRIDFDELTAVAVKCAKYKM